MSEFAGRFVWYELQTTDTKAARAFYGDVVGWGTQVAPVPDMEYTLFTVGETSVGGLMAQQGCDDAAKKATPAWLGYVGVADVDAATAQAQRLGSTVHVPPTDIPNVGRFSMIADPQSVPLALFRGSSPPPGPLPPRGTPGHVGWHELHTTDWQKAFGFYGEMFGWQKAEPFDMGEMGTYQLFSMGGENIGGMFNKPPMEPAPYWLFYVTVSDIDTAAGRVTKGGGKILNGPMQVPGGDWIVQAIDPQGAAFALVGKRAETGG